MNLKNAFLLAAALLLPAAGAHDGGFAAPKTQCESGSETRTHEYGPPSTGFNTWMLTDASIPPCPYGDTTWDGHHEFAMGGTILMAGSHSQICWGAYADHAPGWSITVVDDTLSFLGSDVAFDVYADTMNNNLVPENPNCGDGFADYGVSCVNSCAPGFPPGLDGAYHVYVSGTSGHVYA